MKTIEECVASNIRSLRQAKDWTQQDLAKRADTALSSIQLVETQKRWPDRSTVSKIADALGVSPIRLFQDPEYTPTLQQAWSVVEAALKEKLSAR